MENLTFKDKAKKFWKDHKEAIITSGIVAIIGTIVVVITGKRYNEMMEEFHRNYDNLSLPDNSSIDEGIYTDLAQEIEDAVLEEGLDETYISRTYKVTYPKFGDIAKGIYTVNKLVEVNIKDIGDAKEEEEA